MSEAPPMYFSWDGEAMVPKKPRLADRYFVVGQDYRMVEENERSQASHNHEFAWLTEAWQQLPDDISDLYPSPEHLRKRALIDAGFYNEQIIDAGSKAAALRVASGIQSREPFSLIIVRGPLVVIRSAQSQSRRAMGKVRFEESKRAIMEVISNLVRVESTELVSNAGQAA